MDATRFISLICLFLSYVLLTKQMTFETLSVQDDNTVTTSSPVTNYTIKNCTTSRGLAGNCAERINCDYNTSHIDLTMYAPHGYHSSCLATEVCCPIQYVRPPKVSNDNSLANDDDDDDSDDDD